ncbi:PREDICTED: uncharacterized protein LOC105452574 isoform X2 [Wasmannia auropunctata]|uniref:uncharacterized protein LOC105452574 isoform X2 n=1 Tax=Wasmannia auropunctata TaxID=64793 RepID=UPI0005F09904|nr:PREDICTED: uncharacterized protein LOC105452574 isoform X2 [Wasmannia auropunctata]
MNHLKHIRGISVRASSNSALPLHYGHYGQHADIYFENCKLKSPLLRSTPLFATKKSHGVDAKYLGQFRQDSLRLISKESKTICKQRNKTKSSVTSLKKKSSMHKKLPSESVAKRVCHYSTCQNTKFNSDGISKRPVPQGDAIINGAKNRRSSFIASVEKHPRSYAEMIADYSESLYKESTVGARNNSFHFNNAIRKSPFSTFTVSPPAKKIMNVAEYSKLSNKRSKNGFTLPLKSFDFCNRSNDINNINTIEHYDFQHHGTCTAEAMNKNMNEYRSCATANNSKCDDQSYAKLIADCSKSIHNFPITSVLNDGLVPNRNVSARNSFESIATPTRKTTEETSRKVSPIISAMLFEKNEKVIDLEENDLLREMENVMSDMKSVAGRKVARVDVSKMKESDILQSVDASGKSPDRNHGLREFTKSKKEKNAVTKKLSYQSDKLSKMEKRRKDLELQKHNYSHSSDKTSSPPQHFGNAAKRESSTVRKNSTQVSTDGDTGMLKQPQVKLHMVPSERESVVSINVDQASFGLLDPPNSAAKHLSVVVQSDRKEDLHLTDNQWNARAPQRTKSALQPGGFGPMRISISEDTAPIKQIEFSINGKPVSELKSITARTERLDVVSSVDKIEIRIPFAKDDSNESDKTGDLSKGINASLGQILNVQISANFQDQHTKDGSVENPAKTMRNQYDRDSVPRSSISKSPYLSNNFPKARDETLSSNNYVQQQSTKRMDSKFENTEKNINEYKISGDVDKIQRGTMKDLSAGKTNTITGTSLIREINNVKVAGLNMRRASDNRVPSNTIPWWSSSDSFNKIRKKENNHKPLVPTNRNKQKVSSLNQNLVNESLLSKPKETSNSKTSMKKSQSMNTTSDSSNTISYSSSMKPYEDPKSTFHHAYSFRLKPNKGNSGIIPEIIRNDLNAKDNQALTAKKDINKISGIKQTESITLFRSDTMSIKSKHNVNKEKTSVLRKKLKTPSSAQNLSPKGHQEKKNNYSLKSTRSIDDVSKNFKSKIKDILDAIKPIEKSKNSTLIDCDLKRDMPSRNSTAILNSDLKRDMPSRNSTAILNSGVKEIQNPVITTKDFILNSSTAEIISKKIDKTILTKQIESNTEKLRPKMDISLKKKDLTMKNDATINIKALNKNNVKNIKESRKNEFTNSSSPNFRNSPELMQTFKKQEQSANNSMIFQDKLKQDLKSLEANKNGPNSLLNKKTSSGIMQRSEKLGISEKVPSAGLKQNRPKSLTSIKNTLETIQEFEKLENLTSKLANTSKESSDTTDKLQITKQIQLKSPKNTNTDKIANINKLFSSQTKDQVSENLTDKITGEISQSMKTKRTKVGDMIAKIATQHPKSKDSLSKDCEENCFSKSGLGKRHFSGSTGPSRKSNDSIGFKSDGSKTKSRNILRQLQSEVTDRGLIWTDQRKVYYTPRGYNDPKTISRRTRNYFNYVFC